MATLKSPRASQVKSRARTATHHILNCIPSRTPERDWTMADAVSAGLLDRLGAIPNKKDLRANWWPVSNQGQTGACVGFATADGLLRSAFVRAERIAKTESPSVRFIWMADKETDEITDFPTTFLEEEGTQVKHALDIARKYGCVLETDLPFDGRLSSLSRGAFYAKAAKLRIASYHNLGTNLADWRRWIALNGPVLTRLGVDRTWDDASATNGMLATYMPSTVRGGHAVCLVGYTDQYFIVRNSWGTSWGDKGFAYATDAYAVQAFTEAYGATV